jgi:hypothetical protein
MEYMIEKELELSGKQPEITPEVSLITNLQNLKYSMLADLDDKQIFRDMLLKLDLTDSLID